MKPIKYFLIFATLLFNISCISRGIPIDQQVVYYMEGFKADNYTKVRLQNGDIVYYPDEVVRLVKKTDLFTFDSNDYQKIKMKQKTYYVPKNRLLIQQVQNIRSKSKFQTATKTRPATEAKDEFETITVGEPHSIDSAIDIERTLPAQRDPLEQIAH